MISPLLKLRNHIRLQSYEEFIGILVFGPRGIFRQHGITVILAAYAVHHLRDADNMVALGEEGTIVRQGKFFILLTFSMAMYKASSLVLRPRSLNLPVVRGPDILEDTKTDLATAAAAKSSEPEEDLLRKTGDVILYKYYLESVGWKDGITILALTICAQFCVYFPQFWIKLWIEEDTRHPEDRTGMFYGVYVMLGVVGSISVYWSTL